MRVTRLRERRKFSQEELAHRAGLHSTYVSQLERGLRNPSLDVLNRLASSLNVTLPRMLSDLPDGTQPLKRKEKRGRPRRK
jgi:transcriptional regulator with XRE-family HTH domain